MKKRLVKVLSCALLILSFTMSVNAEQVDIYKPVDDNVVETPVVTDESSTEEETKEITDSETPVQVLKDIRVMLFGILLTTGFTAGSVMASTGGIFKHDRK